jgi:hypothetical protein
MSLFFTFCQVRRFYSLVKITVTILLLVVGAVAVAWLRGREPRWIRAQRADVTAYLDRHGVQHGDVASQPAWYVSPYVAVWSVESKAKPGVVGWWVISGDLPTDYVSGHDAHDPRSALGHFARQWREASAAMLRGEPHPDMTIGTPDQWPELGDLLQRRSQLLARFAEDGSLWK